MPLSCNKNTVCIVHVHTVCTVFIVRGGREGFIFCLINFMAVLSLELVWMSEFVGNIVVHEL